VSEAAEYGYIKKLYYFKGRNVLLFRESQINETQKFFREKDFFENPKVFSGKKNLFYYILLWLLLIQSQ